MEFNVLRAYSDRVMNYTTDRFGGVSKAPYDSLNIALHVEDNPKDVISNRIIISEKLNFLAQNMIFMDQVHKDNIVNISDTSQNKIPSCDGIITNIKNIPLMVMVADCIPLTFFDPIQNVAGVAHAGRNGTFLGISTKMVKNFVDNYNSKVEDIIVGVGVSIHSCCYEVGDSLANIAMKSFGEKYVTLRDEKYFLDIQSLNVDQLVERGVLLKNIEISPICSCCNSNYFSYRREGVTGRFGSFLMLI
jgi:YfiH family protein